MREYLNNLIKKIKNQKNGEAVNLSSVFFAVLLVTALIFVGTLTISSLKTKRLAPEKEKEEVFADQDTSDIWFTSANKEIRKGDFFEIELHINTKNRELGLFAFDLDFNESDLTVVVDNRDEAVIKTNESQNFIIMSNKNDISEGHLRLSGICPQNCVIGEDKHVLTIHAKALNDGIDLSKLQEKLEIKELGDNFGHPYKFKKEKNIIVIK